MTPYKAIVLTALLGGNTGIAVAQTAAPQPGVVKAGAVAPKPGPTQYFTGKVTIAELVKPMPPGRAGTGLVAFQVRARSNWHTHPAGQTLYVTEGCGWTQREGGVVTRICKGDTAYVPAGVRHWHGATDETAMTHLSIAETFDGRNVDWAEPVSDAQFHGPPE
jgi:quercetin dioxygenase-like cupin family protein